MTILNISIAILNLQISISKKIKEINKVLSKKFLATTNYKNFCISIKDMLFTDLYSYYALLYDRINALNDTCQNVKFAMFFHFVLDYAVYGANYVTATSTAYILRNKYVN